MAARGPLSGILCIDDLDRIHRTPCIATTLYTIFPNDCVAGTSSDSESEAERPAPEVRIAQLYFENHNLIFNQPTLAVTQLNAISRIRATPAPRLVGTSGIRHVSSPSIGSRTPQATSQSLRSFSAPTSHSSRISAVPALPKELWSDDWEAPKSSGRITLDQSIDVALFEEASGELDPPTLSIVGVSTIELADALVTRIRIAGRKGDFSEILSSEREFKMWVLYFSLPVYSY